MSRARPGPGMRSSFLASARLSPVPGADDGTAIPALSKLFATASVTPLKTGAVVPADTKARSSRRFILATSVVHTVAAEAVPANISESVASAALKEVFMVCLGLVATTSSLAGDD